MAAVPGSVPIANLGTDTMATPTSTPAAASVVHTKVRALSVSTVATVLVKPLARPSQFNFTEYVVDVADYSGRITLYYKSEFTRVFDQVQAPQWPPVLEVRGMVDIRNGVLVLACLPHKCADGYIKDVSTTASEDEKNTLVELNTKVNLSEIHRGFGLIPYVVAEQKYHFLVVQHRAGGHWTFPKSYPDTGETEVECAVREFKEETQLQRVAVQHALGRFEQTYAFVTKDDTRAVKWVAYWLGDCDMNYKNPKSGLPNVKLGKTSVAAFKWQPFEQTFYTLTHDNTKELFNKVYNELVTANGFKTY